MIETNPLSHNEEAILEVLPTEIFKIITAMDFLIRFAQIHESFRKPELEAIAQLLGIEVEFIHYECEVRT